MTTGLVIGKFYPPHRGHKFLIGTAASQIDHLDVIICVLPEQNPQGHLRAEWLREIHPGVNILEVEDIGYDDDSKRWAEYTKLILRRSPDVVFTSENYGEEYARCMGAKHVMVDFARKNVPVSARQIREHPLAYWDFLEPCVRAFYALRVCVVGAESTGTTTLSRDLAEHYQTVWVPEYGRTYTEEIAASGTNIFTYHWRTPEFVKIAEQQQADEDRLARVANRILICDTDALATCIWHQRYIGSWSKEVEDIATRRRYPVYLLTDCDIPFEFDGCRDGEHIRPWMTKRFSEELTQRGLPWVLVKGTREERLTRAIEEVDRLLGLQV